MLITRTFKDRNVLSSGGVMYRVIEQIKWEDVRREELLALLVLQSPYIVGLLGILLYGNSVLILQEYAGDNRKLE